MNSRIRYFVALAEECHYGRAAERLRMSQPPLSQQIRLLETELGMQLLTRTTRRVELTEAGRVLYEGAKRALDQLDRSILLAQRVQRGEAGVLRIGFVSTAAFELLSRVLRGFRLRHPEATTELFHLTSAQQAAAFEARTIDVGFLREPPAGDVEVEVIDRERLFAVLPARHPLARHRSVSVRALRDEPFVMWDRQQTPGIAHTILELCARHGFQPKIALEVTNPPALLSLVAGGVGVSIVPVSARRLRPEKTVFRPIDDVDAFSPMSVAWRSDNANALVNRFIETVHEVCRGRSKALATATGERHTRRRSARKTGHQAK